MPKVCQICDFKNNLTTRKSTCCPFCEFDACRTCCETYVISQSNIKCMNPACGREWTRQFSRNAFTATFLNKKYKEVREQTLFDQERALLPATQPIVENIIRVENVRLQIADVNQQVRALYERQRELQRQLYQGANVVPNTNERHEFIKSCPDANCRGFLSSQWKCGICEKWACNLCHEIKGNTRDAEHTCNPETVATVALLQNDTRPCPKCRTGIFKIDGCDQMWCTQCHTAFNWRNGRIENVVHNPHYFEWLRRNGNDVPRNPGDVPCRNELTHNDFRDIRNILMARHKDHPLTNSCLTILQNTIQNAIHLRWVIQERYRQVDYVERNQALRVSYMRQHITQDQFKISLQRNEKKNEKSREIRNVLDILFTTVTDIIYRFRAHLSSVAVNKWEPTILEEIDVIVDYANECLADISHTYSSKPIRFLNDIRMR